MDVDDCVFVFDENVGGEYEYEEADEDEENILDSRELIGVVKSNPALYAKNSKEYSGKGFNKDLAWESVGKSLSKSLTGSEASKAWYLIRQRFGKERRKVLQSLKGKSGQGAKAPYVPKWTLYNECLFLADHIVPRKTTSNIRESPGGMKSPTIPAVRPSSSASGSRPTPTSTPSPSSVWSDVDSIFIGNESDDSSRSSVFSPPPPVTAQHAIHISIRRTSSNEGSHVIWKENYSST